MGPTVARGLQHCLTSQSLLKLIRKTTLLDLLMACMLGRGGIYCSGV